MTSVQPRAPIHGADRRASRPGVQLAIATGALVLLVLWSALAGFSAYERCELIERVTDRNTMLARVFAESVARDIEGTALAAATLGDLLVRGLTPDGPEMRAAMAQTLVNLPFLRGFGIVDSQGLVISSTESESGTPLINLSPLGSMPATDRDALGPFISARGLLDLRPAGAHQPIPRGVGFMPLIRTIELRSGQRLHLVALMNSAAFATRQQAMMSHDGLAAALASYDGDLIASTTGVTRAIGSSIRALTPFRKALPRIEHGEWEGSGLRDGAQFVAFRALASRPLVALVEIDADAAMVGWVNKTRGLIAAGLIVTCFIAGVTWIVARGLRARMAARLEIDAAQFAVAQRERELSVTLRSLQELIFRTDANGAITFVNNHWTPVTGTQVSAACGRRPWELVMPADRDRLWSLFATQPGLEARRTQASLIDARGVVRTFDFSVMPLQSGDVISGFAGSAIDVTERVAAERQLQAQLAFTSLVMEISPLPKSVIDLDGRYLIVNQAWQQFTGQRCGEMAFATQLDRARESVRPLHQPHDRHLLQSGQPLRFETSVTHRDGSLRDVVVNQVLLHGPDGRASGILCVFMDVSEFRDAERATREARDAAEETSRAKSEFIANISHELRTPLQSIIGFSELGQMRARPHERLAAMFDDIHGAGQRMLTLVNDLLDVSKIDSTVGAIHLERTDLRGLVRAVLREIDPLLNAKQLQVSVDLPAQPMLAHVDPPRFQQVVRNVLANAIKFAPARSRIDIVGDHTPTGEPRLVLRDQGPGIPVAELETIFEAFVQSSQTKDGSGGTGLGLAICRKIIDAHGGRIHAENLPGRGAAFHIVLPARQIASDENTAPSQATVPYGIAA